MRRIRKFARLFFSNVITSILFFNAMGSTFSVYSQTENPVIVPGTENKTSEQTTEGKKTFGEETSNQEQEITPSKNEINKELESAKDIQFIEPEAPPFFSLEFWLPYKEYAIKSGIIFTFLILAMILISFLRKGFHRLKIKLRAASILSKGSVEFQDRKIIKTRTLWKAANKARGLVHLGLSLLIIYLAVRFSLNQFPGNISEIAAGIFKGILYSVITIAIWITILKGLNTLTDWIKSNLHTRKSGWITDLKLQNYKLFSGKHLEKLTHQALGLVRYTIYLILGYIFIPVILGYFAFSSTWADSLISYILQPVKSVATSLLSYIPDLFFILVIVLFVKYLLKLSHIIFKEIESSTIKFSGFKPDWAMPTYKIVRFLILIFGLIVIFPYLPGSDSEAFKGVSIFLGVLFSLGSTSIVANAVAGLVLTYMDPFRLGDRVQIGESTGDVIEKTILVTRIKTIKNRIITIPNSVVMGAHIINFSSVESKDKLIIHTTVTLGYDVPWRKIHEVLIAAALDTEGVSKSPTPFVHQRSLDDFSVAYELNAYTRDPHAMAGTLSKLHASVQDHCNSAGIEILSPHYRAVRDGNESTIPKESKENTKAPALKKTFKEASKKINEKRKR